MIGQGLLQMNGLLPKCSSSKELSVKFFSLSMMDLILESLNTWQSSPTGLIYQPSQLGTGFFPLRKIGYIAGMVQFGISMCIMAEVNMLFLLPM